MKRLSIFAATLMPALADAAATSEPQIMFETSQIATGRREAFITSLALRNHVFQPAGHPEAAK